MESCGRETRIQICIESAEVVGNVEICFISFERKFLNFSLYYSTLYKIKSCVVKVCSMNKLIATKMRNKGKKGLSQRCSSMNFSFLKMRSNLTS